MYQDTNDSAQGGTLHFTVQPSRQKLSHTTAKSTDAALTVSSHKATSLASPLHSLPYSGLLCKHSQRQQSQPCLPQHPVTANQLCNSSLASIALKKAK